MILFFFSDKIATASSSNSGAITTSQKSEFISLAVAESIFLLAIRTPPKAEVGSQAKAVK